MRCWKAIRVATPYENVLLESLLIHTALNHLIFPVSLQEKNERAKTYTILPYYPRHPLGLEAHGKWSFKGHYFQEAHIRAAVVLVLEDTKAAYIMPQACMYVFKAVDSRKIFHVKRVSYLAEDSQSIFLFMLSKSYLES